MSFLLRALSFLYTTVVLTAQPVIELRSPEITVGDLAAHIAIFRDADPSATLSKAPAPGYLRRVARAELVRWAVGVGVDANPNDLPDELTLRRALRAVGHDEIADAIRRAIVDDYPPYSNSVSIDVLSPDHIVVPVGELRIEHLRRRPMPLGEPVSLNLRWSEVGGRTGIEQVVAVVTIETSWYEAAANLRAGTPLRADNVHKRTGSLPLLSVPIDESFLTGNWSSIRSLRAGELLSPGLLRSVPLISRGDLVELRYEFGGIRLRSPGRAEAAGSASDLLPFHNIATGGRVSARLADQETAYVEATHATR